VGPVAAAAIAVGAVGVDATSAHGQGSVASPLVGIDGPLAATPKPAVRVGTSATTGPLNNQAPAAPAPTATTPPGASAPVTTAPPAPVPTTPTAPAPTETPTTLPPAGSTSAGTLLGVLRPDGTHYDEEYASGFRVVTIAAGWMRAEPSPGTFDANYIRSLNRRIDDARAHGMQVVLDAGIHYPPAWAFSLPGGTRFVNQYGDVYTGAADTGQNALNTVTNPAARAALGEYLRWLGTQIPASKLLAVRVGGGVLGELRYPNTNYNGHTNSWWAYDSDTQAASPVPGWLPGTGTTTDAARFLATYNDNMTSYGAWLSAQFSAAFGVDQLLMLPGWGERPGKSSPIVASRLTIQRDEFNQGLDWETLVTRLPDRARTILYTTYLDSPPANSGPTNPDPATYLSGLAARYGYRLGGENTGNGGRDSVATVVARARSLGLVIVNWMDEDDLVDATAGRAPTLANFGDLSVASRSLSAA
jgi:hypothetical protein